MAITANVHLDSASLPLMTLATSLQSAEIQCPHVIGRKRDSQSYVVEIETSESLSEEKLVELDEVLEATELGSTKGKLVYTLTATLNEAVTEAFDGTPDAGLVGSITVTPEGWYEKKIFEDYPALETFRTSCEDNGVRVEIDSLVYDSPLAEGSSPYGLTGRQHKALTLALSRGYYERPRQITAKKLADELDISQPSMSDLLGRGERQLISATLGSPPPDLEIL